MPIVQEPKRHAAYEILERLYQTYGEAQFFAEGNFDIYGPQSDSPVEPLESIRVYSCDDQVPHWHYITVGLSDLWNQEGSDSDYSGFGFELTMRVPKNDAPTPPRWPIVELHYAATYVFRTGNFFEAFQATTASGAAFSAQDGVTIDMFAIVPDARLEPIDTLTGKVEFLQFAGLTKDEARARNCWDTRKLLDAISKINPIFLSDPYRQSFLANPAVGDVVHKGIAIDGSSVEVIGTDVLEIDEADAQGELRITLSTLFAIPLADAIRTRLAFGRNFKFYGPEGEVLQLIPSDKNSWSRDEQNYLTLALSEATMREIAAKLQPEPTSYTFGSIPKFRLTVVKSEYE